MRNIAIVYTTKNGQTEKIVNHIRKTLDLDGCCISSWNLKNVYPEIRSTDEAIIIASPVYMGRFSSQIKRWVRNNKATFRDKTIGLLSVSLNAADKRPLARKDDDRLLSEFINQVGVVPNFVASFAGALSYSKYSPLIRFQLKRIAAEAEGDTDTSNDYEYTDWSSVSEFAEAVRMKNLKSSFATTNRLSSNGQFYNLMPEFEIATKNEIVINANPSEILVTLNNISASKTTLANLLAKVRTLSLGKSAVPQGTFSQGAEEFGVIPLPGENKNEIVGGLIGRFWRLDFGIHRISPAEFRDFDEPDYVKVLIRFKVDPVDEAQSRFIAEMHIHATDEQALRKFSLYWRVFNPGIRLYLRSILSAIKKDAESLHTHEMQTREARRLLAKN